MLRKKDLAKEFSLVVQQEIKNHNNQLLATNVALNKFETTLDEFSRCITREVDKIKSDLGHLSMNRRLDIEENKTAFRHLADNINVNDKINEDFHNCASLDLDEIEATLIDKSEITRLDNKIELYVKEGRAAIKSLSEQIICNEQRLERLLKALEEKLLSKINDPSNIEGLQTEFNKKLEGNAVDNNSLIDEVKACKYAGFLNEKKIENLYTIHQRLKNKLEEGG